MSKKNYPACVSQKLPEAGKNAPNPITTNTVTPSFSILPPLTLCGALDWYSPLPLKGGQQAERGSCLSHLLFEDTRPIGHPRTPSGIADKRDSEFLRNQCVADI